MSNELYKHACDLASKYAVESGTYKATANWYRDESLDAIRILTEALTSGNMDEIKRDIERCISTLKFNINNHDSAVKRLEKTNEKTI